jgi:hypothetical protein
MVGRIFDGLGKPRVLLHIPPFLWRVAFKAAKPWFANVNIEMGKRMIKDMTYDDAKAKSDFGWSPRSFTPIFGDRTA